MMKTLTLSSVIFLICSLLLSAETQIVDVSPAKAEAILAEKEAPQVIDVRTPEEYAEGHIKGAVLIDVNGDDFEKKLSQLDKSKPYLVHCRSGGRSGRAMSAFKKLGFQQIYHLNKGMLGWEAAGMPVVKGEQ